MSITDNHRFSTVSHLPDEIDSETRFKIIRTMKALYWEKFEDG